MRIVGHTLLRAFRFDTLRMDIADKERADALLAEEGLQETLRDNEHVREVLEAVVDVDWFEVNVLRDGAGLVGLEVQCDPAALAAHHADAPLAPGELMLRRSLSAHASCWHSGPAFYPARDRTPEEVAASLTAHYERYGAAPYPLAFPCFLPAGARRVDCRHTVVTAGSRRVQAELLRALPAPVLLVARKPAALDFLRLLPGLRLITSVEDLRAVEGPVPFTLVLVEFLHSAAYRAVQAQTLERLLGYVPSAPVPAFEEQAIARALRGASGDMVQLRVPHKVLVTENELSLRALGAAAGSWHVVLSSPEECQGDGLFPAIPRTNIKYSERQAFMHALRSELTTGTTLQSTVEARVVPLAPWEDAFLARGTPPSLRVPVLPDVQTLEELRRIREARAEFAHALAMTRRRAAAAALQLLTRKEKEVDEPDPRLAALARGERADLTAPSALLSPLLTSELEQDVRKDRPFSGTVGTCSVCMERETTAALRGCMHLYCQHCVERILAGRRRCPMCGDAFHRGDVVTLIPEDPVPSMLDAVRRALRTDARRVVIVASASAPDELDGSRPLLVLDPESLVQQAAWLAEHEDWVVLTSRPSLLPHTLDVQQLVVVLEDGDEGDRGPGQGGRRSLADAATAAALAYQAPVTVLSRQDVSAADVFAARLHAHFVSA